MSLGGELPHNIEKNITVEGRTECCAFDMTAGSLVESFHCFGHNVKI